MIDLTLAKDKQSRADFWEKMVRLANEEPLGDGPRQRGEIIMPGYSRRVMYGIGEEPPEGYWDHRVTTAAIEAMERYAKQDKPFVIHCGGIFPHDPYMVPEEYAKMYDPKSVEIS